jgi:hypothetical protein
MSPVHLSDATTDYVPDRWIALSSLQKSIRRGAAEPATAAAEVLWGGPSRLLDRLLVIGLEDIGVGDPEVLREVIELTTDRAWRRKLPGKGRAVTLGLVDRMCAATKSRFADEVLAIGALEPDLGLARTELVMASADRLADFCATSDDMGVRALASWFLAGTARYPMDDVPRRQGQLAAVWDVARGGASRAIGSICSTVRLDGCLGRSRSCCRLPMSARPAELLSSWSRTRPMRHGGVYRSMPWISSPGAGVWPSDAGLQAVPNSRDSCKRRPQGRLGPRSSGTRSSPSKAKSAVAT